MAYLFGRCRGKRTVLIAPDDILKNIANPKNGKYEITRKQLETHMKNIVLDGYVDYSFADKTKSVAERDGAYVVTLTTRGEAYQRERDEKVKRMWQSVAWKIFLTTIGVIFGIALTKLLGQR